MGETDSFLHWRKYHHSCRHSNHSGVLSFETLRKNTGTCSHFAREIYSIVSHACAVLARRDRNEGWKTILTILYISVYIPTGRYMCLLVCKTRCGTYQTKADTATYIVKKTWNFNYFTTITHDYKLATRWFCWVENKYETFSVIFLNFFPG